MTYLYTLRWTTTRKDLPVKCQTHNRVSLYWVPAALVRQRVNWICKRDWPFALTRRQPRCNSACISGCSSVVSHSHVSPYLIIGVLLAVSGWVTSSMTWCSRYGHAAGKLAEWLSGSEWLVRCGQPWTGRNINQCRLRPAVMYATWLRWPLACSRITCILSQVYWRRVSQCSVRSSLSFLRVKCRTSCAAYNLISCTE